MYKKSPKNIWQSTCCRWIVDSDLLITHWCHCVGHSLQHQQQHFYFLARLTLLKSSLQMQSSQKVGFMSTSTSFLMIANWCSNEINAQCVLHPSRQCFLPHRCPVRSFPHHLKTVRFLKFLCCLTFSRRRRQWLPKYFSFPFS